MRIATATCLAVLGLLVWGEAASADGTSAEVSIHAHIEARAEWAPPAQAQPGPEMDAGDGMKLQQLLRAFTNAKAALTWTLVRSTAPGAQPTTSTAETIIDSPRVQVAGWSGADTGRTPASAGEIVEIILTLSWV